MSLDKYDSLNSVWFICDNKYYRLTIDTWNIIINEFDLTQNKFPTN